MIEKIIDYAQSFVSKKYDTHLSVHPSFRSILKEVCAPPGADVSSAWVYHVFKITCQEKNKFNPLIPTPFPAVLWHHFLPGSYKADGPFFQTKKKIVCFEFTEEMPAQDLYLKPGDIFFTINEAGQWHCGIVKEAKKSGLFTIETACSNIVNKRRDYSSIKKAIRFL